jgi:hypothetical protein
MKKIVSQFTQFNVFGHALMILFLGLSVYFYKERIFYYDSAYQCFKFLNTECFNIEAFRYSTVLSQIFPWLAIKANLPIKAVIIIYSMSFFIVGYIIYYINVHVLKNLVAGLSILLIYSLGISDTFFYSVTELPQGIMFATLFYAWLYFPLNSKKNIPLYLNFVISLVILLFCLFYHPMTLFAIGFIIGYYYIDTLDFKNKNIALLISSTIILYSLKIVLTTKASYEGNLFEQLKLTPQLLPKLFSLYSYYFFYSRLYTLYLISYILSIVVIIAYIIKKNWRKLAWFLVSLFGFLIITFITFNKGDSDMAMEKYFVPLSLFIAIPFLQDVLIKANFKVIRIAFFVIIVLLGIKTIVKHGKLYTKHIHSLDNMNELAEKRYKTHKLILDRKMLKNDMVSWACSNETMLYSALKGKNNCISVYLNDLDDLDDFNPNNFKSKDLYLCVPFDLCWKSSNLNHRFFSLPIESYVYSKEDIDAVDTLNTELYLKMDLTKNNFNYPLNLIKNEHNNKFYETENEFIPFIEKSVGEIIKNQSSYIDIIVHTEIKVPKPIENDALYLTITQDNGLYVVSTEYNDLQRDSLGWTNITLERKIRDIENVNSIIKIYIWNKMKQRIQIRKFELYTQK